MVIKLGHFFLNLHKDICCEYSLEAYVFMETLRILSQEYHQLSLLNRSTVYSLIVKVFEGQRMPKIDRSFEKSTQRTN